MARTKKQLETALRNSQLRRREDQEALGRFAEKALQKVAVWTTPGVTAMAAAKFGDQSDFWEVRGTQIPKAVAPMLGGYVLGFIPGPIGAFFEGMGDGNAGAVSYMAMSAKARRDEELQDLRERAGGVSGNMGAGYDEQTVREMMEQAEMKGYERGVAEQAMDDAMGTPAE